jgi:CRP/FNR family transcriptional regulator
MKDLLTKHYGYLFEDALIQEIISVSQEKKVKQGEVLINHNQPILYMPLLISGAIKISRLDEDKEELLLYFLESGDTCTMTMSCCIGNKKSEIRAVAEQDTHMVMIPVANMALWLEKYASWRTFVFDSYNTRFNELLEAIDNLAFNNMHDRLHKYLKDKVLVNKTEIVDATHQQIAYDLHSSRVVISRLLKALEKEGAIKLFRNKIEVLNF